MAHIIKLNTFSDNKRGSLTVMDDIKLLIPFKIKRVFYIYDVDADTNLNQSPIAYDAGLYSFELC